MANGLKCLLLRVHCVFLQVILRAKFSSITEAAISKAFHSLTNPNWDEARSVDGRMELDLRIGCAFTRFQTKSFQVSYSWVLITTRGHKYGCIHS